MTISDTIREYLYRYYVKNGSVTYTWFMWKLKFNKWFKNPFLVHNVIIIYVIHREMKYRPYFRYVYNDFNHPASIWNRRGLSDHNQITPGWLMFPFFFDNLIANVYFTVGIIIMDTLCDFFFYFRIEILCKEILLLPYLCTYNFFFRRRPYRFFK